MELEPIDELFIKRKVHISTVGWLTAIISGLIIYFITFSFVDLFLFNYSYEINELLSIAADVKLQMEETIRLAMVVECAIGLVAILFLFSAIGLIRYRKWARKIFVSTSWIFIVLSFVVLLLYAFAFSKYTSGLFPTDIKPISSIDVNDSLAIFKLISKVKLLSYAIVLILTIRGLFRVCLKFNKKEYKRLFI
ncbi:hypothetical protein [Plebeiibacterium sediminum]|uniref:Uncharacterized protein n=1 Tax=Plebeiibacterium sediminum TaxID=2992112 RepID=A0AAE3SIX1_9BACT|nr:hypothetical protein [Plebeiobacterium sediminum]MCW3789723.1 hypothetical protein [Plebeiobacterium sediminum]